MKKLIFLLFSILFLFACPMNNNSGVNVSGELAEPFYIALPDGSEHASVKMMALKITIVVPTFIYRYENGDGAWREVNLTNDDVSTQTFELTPGNSKVYIKAKEQNASLSGKIQFKCEDSTTCAIGGNIMSLLNPDPAVYGTTQRIVNMAFMGLFSNFTGLVDASKLLLPVNKLSKQCYSTLFMNSEDLKYPPTLPANDLREGERCYSEMFYGCKSLEVAPELSSTRLASGCYYAMFSGCEKLKEMPVLPSANLAETCYQYMFMGCKELKEVKALPATVLQDNCYYGMFQDCINIKNAPAELLKATTMRKSCYSNMFSGCKSLTNAPSLPSVRLDEGCYENMFYGCSEITSCSLPATALKKSCYKRMFTGCSKLERIDVAFKEWDESSTAEWVIGVKNAGVFYSISQGLPSERGINRIPDDWQIMPDENFDTSSEDPIEFPDFLNDDDKLSEPMYFQSAESGNVTVRMVANSAFRDKLNLLPKFQYSTNKTDWTDVTITDLENTSWSHTFNSTSGKVYLRAKGDDQTIIEGIHFISDKKVKVGGNIMSLLSDINYKRLTKVNISSFANLFKGMEKLVDASELLLPATELATSCYSGMFQDCTALVSAPEIVPANLQANCYSAMFSGCKSLTTAPVLNSRVLSSYCYSEMFKGCESLINPPDLPAKYVAIGCYSQMFEGCKSLIRAPELPSKIMLESCYSKMFKGCSKITTPPALPAGTVVEDADGKTSADGVIANLCYSYMFAECTSLQTAPSLPATKLMTGCYTAMFMSCRALKKAPVLPALELANFCYVSMFKDCQQLEEVKVNFVAWDDQATTDWLSGVKSSGTFKCQEALTVDYKAGVDTIPGNWTVEYFVEE